MLHVQEQAQRLKGKLRSLYTLGHPWPQQHWCPLGSCLQELLGTLQAQALLPIPSSRDAPAVMVCPHGIACARLCSSLRGWKVSQQLGVLAVQRPQPPSSALGEGQHGGCMMGRVGPGGWEEASCFPQGDSDQPGWQKESTQGSRLVAKTDHLLLLFLLTCELPETGPPCSSVPAGVNWIWRSC